MIKKVQFINYSINVSGKLLDTLDKTKGREQEEFLHRQLHCYKMSDNNTMLYFVQVIDSIEKNEWIGCEEEGGEKQRKKLNLPREQTEQNSL